MCRASQRAHCLQKGLSVIEGLIALIAVAALVVIANHYLERHITQAERTTLASIARNFSTTMTMIHGKWVIEGKPGSQRHQPAVMIDSQPVYLSKAGWPVRAGLASKTEQHADEGCAELWQLVTGAAITTADTAHKTKARYIASSPDNQLCRYALIEPGNQPYSFDYSHKSGHVQLSSQKTAATSN